MRIQHNINALNAHRNLSMNNSAVGKNLEKLSSGFRINRAGDDAAGLAISEKMRGQIRGLDMATRNSNDGISLIQTAEGALAETHSILQRMRELSVQSSNGTYEEGAGNTDRNQLQKETQALKDEIDRIASSTHFNNKKLLNGNLGQKTDTSGALAGGGAVTAGTAGQAGSAATKQIIEIDMATLTTTTAATTLEINGKSLGTLAASANKAAVLADVVAKYNASTETEHTGYIASASGDKLVLTAKTEGAMAAFDTEVTVGGTGAVGSLAASMDITTAGKDLGSGEPAAAAKYAVEIDFTKLSGGESIKIGDSVIKFTTDGTATSTKAGAQTIDISKVNLGDAAAKMAARNTAMTALATAVQAEAATAGGGNVAGTGAAVAVTDNTATKYKMTFTATTVGAASNLGVFRANDSSSNSGITTTQAVKGADESKGKEAKFAKASFKLDIAKLAKGDVFEIDGKKVTVIGSGETAKNGEWAVGGTSADLIQQIEAQGFTKGKLTEAGGVFTVESDQAKDETGDAFAATLAGKIKLTVASTGGTTTTFPTEGVTFQIGANGTEDDRVTLKVADQSTTTLGINGVDISTDIGANAAIDLIDKATASVSATRADLGALQNRLEHTVNNLGTTVENLTAAESRIRDVDMAKEMMEMTKNNILSQAAQSMLAQANTQPQGVLQLLQ